MTGVRRALTLSLLDRYTGFVVSLAATMVLARLLTPAEMGAYSVVMVLSAFVAVFRDFGAGQYLIRHPNPTPEVQRRTFAVQLGIGTLLGVLMAAAGEPLARFYAEPRMRAVCWVLGANFALTPFLAYPVAWLSRGMRFGTLAWCRVTGAVAGAATSIGMVLAGLGPIALAWGNVATTAFGILVLLAFVRLALPWRPLWTGLREVISFGGVLTVASILHTLRGGLPELVVGRMMGLTQASYLSRGQGLCNLFDTLIMGAVGAVTLPYLSKARREGRPLAPILSHGLSLVCGLGWPFFAMLAVLAEPLMRVLFGDQWVEAAAPARWLALVAAAGLPLSLLWPALVSGGKVRALVGMNVAAALAVAAGLAIGANSGLTAATRWMGLFSTGSTVACLWALRGPLELRTMDVADPLVRALLLAAAAALPALLWTAWIGPVGFQDSLLVCAAGLTSGIAAAALVAHQLKHALWTEVAGRPWRKR